MNNQTQYWMDESYETLDSARILFQNKKFLEFSFLCHLSCEKMLKAAYAHHTSEVPPKTHSLSSLAHLAGLVDRMAEANVHFLNQLDAFQLEGLYLLDRQQLYQTTTLEEFQMILNKTEEILLWIQQQIT